MRGKLLVIEGTEGSGKSTQIAVIFLFCCTNSNTMMLSRVVSGKYDVFLASDDFIDVTTLTQMDYMIMDSEEMR